jgi:hypothetical protein
MTMPSFSSSPWMRGAPQRKFAQAISRISWRVSAAILGRPPCQRPSKRKKPDGARETSSRLATSGQRTPSPAVQRTMPPERSIHDEPDNRQDNDLLIGFGCNWRGELRFSTVEQTRKLVEEEGVAFIYGTAGTGNLAIRKYLNDRRVPQPFIAAPNTTIRNIFRGLWASSPPSM